MRFETSPSKIALLCGIAATLLVGLAVTEARAESTTQPSPVSTTKPATGSAVQHEFGDEFFFSPHSKPVQQKLDSLVGKPAPALQVADWINGEVKPEDTKGKVVVVDIWATWCGPCIRSIPHNNEMYAKYKEKGLVIIGVCSSSRGQEKLAAVAAAEKTKINYPVCKDPGDKTSKAFNLGFYPTYIVIDRKGVVRAAGVRPNKVEEIVLKLLDEKAE